MCALHCICRLQIVPVSCESISNAHPSLNPQLMIVSRMRDALDEASCLGCCLGLGDARGPGFIICLLLPTVQRASDVANRMDPLLCQEQSRLPSILSLKHTCQVHLSLKTQHLECPVKSLGQYCLCSFVH
jgi:hypothetical protein